LTVCAAGADSGADASPPAPCNRKPDRGGGEACPRGPLRGMSNESEMGSFVLLAADGAVHELPARERPPQEGGGFLWEHVELTNGERALLEGRNLPDVVLTALVASETRPRCEQIGGGAFINLRGPALDPSSSDDRLVSIRAWARGNRVLSVSRRTLSATRDVVSTMRAGQLTDPGDLVSAFCQGISSELDPVIAGLGDEMDDCESELQPDNIYQLRRRITQGRSEAIAFRRFIAPNRDALATLAALPMEWLSEQDRLHIHEAADRFARMAEELEAIRERAALLHEQLTDLRAELIDQRSLLIAVVAFIFLPLTFITGLLGMNVDGIPFAHQPWAFWGVVAFCLLVGVAVFAWFMARHWLGK
jgi:zinc transporter